MWSSDESQGTFAETLNAVRHKYNHLQYQLKGAWSVRTAWQHLEPGTSRAPVPPVLLCALVAACLLWGGPWIEFAVCIALCFEGALRPGELLALARVDVRFPSESGSADGSVYVILRHTKTSQTRGARWQHVRIQSPRMVCMLWSHLGTRPGHEYVFSYAGTPAARAARLTAMFGSALHELGVPYGVAHGYVLSSLRAGAITTLYQRCGDLQRVRWYGRWDSLRTMEHYVQELPQAAVFAELDATTRAQLAALARLLPQMIRRAALDMSPPPFV